MMNIYYKNHFGEIVNLRDRPYYLLTGDLLDYKWNVRSNANQITGFDRDIVEKSVTFEIFTTKAEYHKALDAVTEIFEKDVMAGIPGRLYFNEQYLRCYITESRKTEWESDVLAVTELTVTTDYPYWIMEQEESYPPVETESKDNKSYPFRYAYRYSNGLSDKDLINDHYADTDFRLVFIGPAVNPAVFIADHLYQVNMKLEAGEYVTIDSSTATVVLTRQNGTRVNAFNYRGKDQDIFQKIPQGRCSVKWSGEFGFDITLLKERSQPRCA